MEGIIPISILLVAFLGYVCNIIEIAQAHSVTGMVILRSIGVLVAPLGAILGFI